MPLTNGHDVFAALHETAINKFIHNVVTVRRYYVHLAVPPLGVGVPGTDFMILPPLPVPGTSYGLAYSLEISQPVIDFTPKDAANNLPPPLNLSANQFSLSVTVKICLLCGYHVQIQNPDPKERQPGKGSRPDGGDTDTKPDLICTKLQIWAIGHPTVADLGPTDKLIGLQIDDIVVKEVCDLEQIMECIAKESVNALLDNVRLTLSRIALGAFPIGLVLEDGPKIADDQLQVWANIV